MARNSDLVFFLDPLFSDSVQSNNFFYWIILFSNNRSKNLEINTSFRLDPKQAKILIWKNWLLLSGFSPHWLFPVFKIEVFGGNSFGGNPFEGNRSGWNIFGETDEIIALINVFFEEATNLIIWEGSANWKVFLLENLRFIPLTSSVIKLY